MSAHCYISKKKNHIVKSATAGLKILKILEKGLRKKIFNTAIMKDRHVHPG